MLLRSGALVSRRNMNSDVTAPLSTSTVAVTSVPSALSSPSAVSAATVVSGLLLPETHANDPPTSSGALSPQSRPNNASVTVFSSPNVQSVASVTNSLPAQPIIATSPQQIQTPRSAAIDLGPISDAGSYDAPCGVSFDSRQVFVMRPSPPVLDFWPHSVSGWLYKIHQLLATESIVDQLGRFRYAVRCIDQQEFQRIQSRLPNESDPSCYDKLKNLLLEVFSPNPALVARSLYSGKLHGLRPDDLMRNLRQAFCVTPDNKSDLDAQLKHAFLCRLPREIQSVLYAQIHENSDTLLQKAMLLYNVRESTDAPSYTHNVHVNQQVKQAAPDTDSKIDALRAMVEELQKTVQQSHRAHQRDVPSRTNYRSDYRTTANFHAYNPNAKKRGSLSHSADKVQSGGAASGQQPRPDSEGPLCFYHTRFGDKARNCVGECIKRTEGGQHFLGQK